MENFYRTAFIEFPRWCCGLLLSTLGLTDALGQSANTLGIKTELEVGTVVSSDSTTPFWIRSNQYGAVPVGSPGAIFFGKLLRDYTKSDSLTSRPKRFDWGFVLNPVAMADPQNKFKIVLPEAHFKLRWRRAEFYVGRRRDIVGIGDSTLSSGFFIGSGNSIPIPKIQIATIGYVPLGFTKNFVAINAGFAHGWINNPPYIEDARLHQKYIYIKLGKPSYAVKLYFGGNHQVLWAGRSEYLKQRPELALNGELPSSWSFFPNVVFAYTSKEWYKRTGYTSFDSYRVGNHLGTFDAGVEATISGRKLLFYHQHPYEDVSGILFQNIPDGLWGINYALNVDKYRPWGITLTRLTAEFLTTKDQSGATFYVPGSTYQGRDNYFNHAQYTEGWSYFGKAVGTPFIMPENDLKKVAREFVMYFPNNRLNVWYLGAQMVYRENVLITMKTSYSRNFGVIAFPFSSPLSQFSGLISAQFPMPAWYKTYVTVKLSSDFGGLLAHNIGGYIGIKKTW
jgi:hypothetical protein